jgi:hypothetical protein
MEKFDHTAYEAALEQAQTANQYFDTWKTYEAGPNGPNLPESGKAFWRGRHIASIHHAAHLLEQAGVQSPTEHDIEALAIAV